MNIHIRQAVSGDIPALRELIDASVRGLQVHDYTRAQIELALQTVYGVDSQLIADGTYYVAERESGASTPVIAGCGGWS
ncbi:MAG: GNAT family N-acetyltransferase, partial [Candidatus Acidiferrales bacterium]